LVPEAYRPRTPAGSSTPTSLAFWNP